MSIFCSYLHFETYTSEQAVPLFRMPNAQILIYQINNFLYFLRNPRIIFVECNLLEWGEMLKCLK